MRSPRKHGDELDDPHANVLYHFTNIESLALILGTASLRMGPLGFTNDPHEFGPWIPEYSANIEEGYEDCPSVEELLQGLIREGERDRDSRLRSLLLCTSRQMAPSQLSVPTIAPLWAHYAAKHTGVCVALDRASLVESALKAAGSLATHLRHRDVEYVRDWLDVDHVYSTSPPIAVGHDLEGTLGKKDFCWSYEQEYRLILIVPTSEPVGELLVPISGCVKRLYCGVRVTAAGRLVAAAFARAFKLSSLDVMEQTALGLQATEEPIPGS